MGTEGLKQIKAGVDGHFEHSFWGKGYKTELSIGWCPCVMSAS